MKQITLNPVTYKTITGSNIHTVGAVTKRKEGLIPSFEVYLFRPSDIEKVAEILR